MTGTIAIAAPADTSLSVPLFGVHLGMGFSINGAAITASRTGPVVGSYQLTVVAKDCAGRTTSAWVPVTVKAR